MIRKLSVLLVVITGLALMGEPQMKIGVAEQKMDIPLFAELYGYGVYVERRNRGVLEDLYCRAYSFNDGTHRALIIYTDTCSTDTNYAREMREKLSTAYGVEPQGIAFVATHTHSAPALHNNPNGFPSGIPLASFQEYWKDMVMKVAGEALANEEPIASIEGGKTVIEKKISRNRVEREKNITDPAIRWAKFKRADGTVKLFLHNFGMHGVTANGSLWLMASSDWPGAVNRLVKEDGICEMPLFMLGPAGDQMPLRTCLDLGSIHGTSVEAGLYMDTLKQSLASGEAVSLGAVTYDLKTIELPSRTQTAEQLREDAISLRDTDKASGNNYWSSKAGRLEEMAMLLEQGKDLSTKLDFQVIRIGDLHFFFVPGELYVEPGIRLLESAKTKYPFVATVANGNGAYFFTEDSGRKYPDIRSRDNKVFGFYEINLYMMRHAFRYENNVADFVVDSLLEMEK